MVDNNGVSDESARAQIAANARKLRETYESDNADAMALAATFDKTLDAAIALAPRLAAALRARRESYHRAVIAERQRSRAVGEESRESEIGIRRYARDFRSPLGALESLSEYSLSVPSDTFDDSLVESRQIKYVDVGATPRPLRS